MDKYAETKQIINDMASVKMAMNSHKGQIEDIHPDKIMTCIRGEICELETAIHEDEHIVDILQEVADVQNFLIAVAHQQIKKYRSRK
jgi:DNA-binding FrmR family transcriptional regulator